jgi:hypothetical protein
VLTTATSGTATTAPMIPNTTPPTETASTIASGCSRTMRPITSGANRWASICWTATMPASTSRATIGPWVTKATSTAMPPETKAPTSGTKPPKNTSTPSGSASGTDRMSSQMVTKTPSKVDTTTVLRT